MIYEVEFDDGDILEYSANAIAENMLNQIDSEGFSTTMLAGIVDHCKDENVAISRKNGYVVTKRGNKKKIKTTKGWKLLVHWKDDSKSWVNLKDIKASHPIEVAEYARAREIDNEPAFSWWVPYTLKKRDIIIAAVKSRVHKATHKYGIEIPRNVRQAHAIDQKNNNTLWKDAIDKEMLNVGVAFEVLDDNKTPLVGWSKVTGHMIFDVKMDFTRKARWVLDGHKTPEVEGSTYAGVVSRESVRIALTYATLNDLQVCVADIRNAYLQAPSSQKDYIICGPEFGCENEGKRAKIHRALYGGKAAGRDFRNHLRSCMLHLGYETCRADPDVWMRKATKPDGTSCYEYILLYVDDALAVGIEAEKMLREIGQFFELKEESIGPPVVYLGGKMRLVQLENGVKAWGISSSQYVKAAVENVERYLREKGESLDKTARTPMRTSYSPELDVSPELGPQDSSYYQSLIGVLRWMVELGRVDICLEVSLLSSQLALPRMGHLASVLHIFAYLKCHHNAEIVLDPSDPVVDESLFAIQDWTTSEFGHVQGEEEVPEYMPEPRGQAFVIQAKVDADHASDTVSRKSRTGFLVWINCALVQWQSKKQSSIETSSFGSEFTAMKQVCEYVRGL
jgi:Reverse transcriptase (RNA-dependent DNA polymerase)